MRPDQRGKARSADLVAPGSVDVYLTLCQLYSDKGSASMDRLAGRCGLDRSTTRNHLRRLREVGLISWEPHKRGTLQPLYGRVPS